MPVFLTWLSSGVSKALPWILLLLTTIAGAFGLRQSGKNAAYAEMDKKQQVQTDETLKVTQSISNMSDTDVASKLRQFYRD